MAKVEKNIILEGLSGMLGDQLVLKKRKGQMIVSTKPRFADDREWTDNQKNQHDRFREAIAYAKSAKELEIYQKKADGTPKTAFNVATADFLHPPEIKEIDVSGYTGKSGEKIKVHCIDDVVVKEVSILISAADNTLVEQGKAIQDGMNALNWIYATTRDANTPHIKVIVDVADLPGHVSTGKAEKDF